MVASDSSEILATLQGTSHYIPDFRLDRRESFSFISQLFGPGPHKAV